MKKRFLSIFLCAATALSTLAGCGGSGSSDTASPKAEKGESKAEETKAEDAKGTGKTRLRMTYWNSEDTMQSLLDHLAEAVPDVEIEFQFIDNSNYDTIVDTQLSAGEGPDIICESPGSSLKHARLDYLMPLNDLAGKYSDEGTSVYSYNGNNYALQIL